MYCCDFCFFSYVFPFTRRIVLQRKRRPRAFSSPSRRARHAKSSLCPSLSSSWSFPLNSSDRNGDGLSCQTYKTRRDKYACPFQKRSKTIIPRKTRRFDFQQITALYAQGVLRIFTLVAISPVLGNKILYSVFIFNKSRLICTHA